MGRPMMFAIPLWLALGQASLALEVTPGSHCATYCVDKPEGNPFKASDSTTTPQDISCKDIDYSTTDTGIKFRKCLECLGGSTKADKGESDLKWYIYNLRYTLTTCLYSEPEAPPNGTVGSSCNIDRACKPLKDPLTDGGVKPVPQEYLGFCTAHDGSFMGSNLAPCISCLQATSGEAYLSNFMTALEAGCKQDPAEGSLLGISGSVFSTTAINITDPTAKSKDDGGNGLSPSAIAGIVVGVVLVFLAAAALFTVHWRRERTLDDWDRRYYGSGPASPATYRSRGGVALSNAHRRYYTGNAFGDKTAASYASSGDYYDQVEAEMQASRLANAPDPRFYKQASSSALPTHHAYRGPLTSRVGTQASQAQPPSPPAAIHKPERTSTPDSFAVQQYLNAAEDSARLATRSPPPAPQQETRVNRSSKVPSIHLPSLSKLRIPKIRRSTMRMPETSTPGGLHRGHEMQISQPVRQGEQRFHDRPIGGPVVTATDRHPVTVQQDIIYFDDDYREIPLRSGKSTLYGY
ncbi:LPXTG-domain-containing protein [Purpureocillium lavendulum]|uniref:LPXTG-domain-containing protein n=1 Tax=Purpureocillium lavendulum TaxID=1247861 RepID=A0AB34FJ99_9HYPO|nr:LPXTG-domain-containing protein [Purpureocillium lavendulum]